jgi:uncharacterized protein YndB with AHSA1/START domain
MNEELGTISPCYTIRIERKSRHPVERVWRAITQSKEVSAWMGYPTQIDLRPGGEFTVDFNATHPGEVLDGVIARVEPLRRLQYVWGSSVVEWLIDPDGDGSRYAFVHSGLALRDVPDEEGLAAGWHDFLEGLEGHLEGMTRDLEAGKRRWEELKPRYRVLLAAAVGDALKVGGER